MEFAEVYKFWFGDDIEKNPLAGRRLWWTRPEGIDEEITAKFGSTLKSARAGELSHWLETPRGLLALIVVLDQFPRHIFRGKPEAFASDDQALQLCLDGLKVGRDRQLHWSERQFFLMPLEHSEDLLIQNRAVQEFEILATQTPPEHQAYIRDNLDFAIRHKVIVERFGRFPHRNAILGRVSTPDEIEFLKQPGSSF